MNTIKNRILLVGALLAIVLVSGFAKGTSIVTPKEIKEVTEVVKNKTINMFVTHGHCSTPFGGIVDDLKVDIPARMDAGNPLENMRISFEVDPNSLRVCRGDEADLTSRIKTKGVFINDKNDSITFRTTNVFVMGVDWYQINGVMSIKGVEREVKFFATGIREFNNAMASSLVLQGQVNLLDWGIDYDKLVNGQSSNVPTKWLYLNMKIELS
ncbi:YceI-like domain-containing protein [Tenacibaculum gallaicum]|uniref:YceI-like domain-containing protein n=1 Tax=Tenacibaculum gallaicum TaxID=561505 RepID=A0A3E0IBC1_9FLAO|nr:YceI family protein [Tenacibaculum gallaicum]REH56036.1 YceI-like domain-containing protein [Tenacibaculum gallaicum]